MSGFTEAALEKKLVELNNSQQSIQTLSLWLIHHRKHCSGIVKVWYKEFLKAKESNKLTFVYLLNDVIQNGKKKSPEFGKEFGTIMAAVLAHLGSLVPANEKRDKSLLRLLQIWEERSIYTNEQISGFKEAFETGLSKRPSFEPPAKIPRRDSEGSGPKIQENGSNNLKPKSSVLKDKAKPKETEVVDAEGRKERHITLSPHSPARDPPEPEELIRALQDLENSASGDAVVREKIAKLPPEVSDVNLLSKISDRKAAERLSKQTFEALALLNEYNNRLAKEMDVRKNISRMLRDFVVAQKDLLAQAEERLGEYKEKLQTIYQVRQELQSHIQSLPDLTKLPDVLPLPSAGDLFNS